MDISLLDENECNDIYNFLNPREAEDDLFIINDDNEALINKKLDQLYNCLQKNGYYNYLCSDGKYYNFKNILSYKPDEKIEEYAPKIFYQDISFNGIVPAKCSSADYDLENKEICEECYLCQTFIKKIGKTDPKKDFPLNRAIGIKYKNYYFAPNSFNPLPNSLLLISEKHNINNIEGTQYEILNKNVWKDLNKLTVLFDSRKTQNKYHMMFNYLVEEEFHFNIKLTTEKPPINFYLDEICKTLGQNFKLDNLNEKFKVRDSKNLYNYHDDDNKIKIAYNSDNKIGILDFEESKYNYFGSYIFTNEKNKIESDEFINMIIKTINFYNSSIKVNFSFISYYGKDTIGYLFFFNKILDKNNFIDSNYLSDYDIDLDYINKFNDLSGKYGFPKYFNVPIKEFNIESIQNLVNILSGIQINYSPYSKKNYNDFSRERKMLQSNETNLDIYNYLLCSNNKNEIYYSMKNFFNNNIKIDSEKPNDFKIFLLTLISNITKNKIANTTSDDNKLIFIFGNSLLNKEFEAKQVTSIINNCPLENTVFFSLSMLVKNLDFYKYHMGIIQNTLKKYYNIKLNEIPKEDLELMKINRDLFKDINMTVKDLENDSNAMKLSDNQYISLINYFLKNKDILTLNGEKQSVQKYYGLLLQKVFVLYQYLFLYIIEKLKKYNLVILLDNMNLDVMDLDNDFRDRSNKYLITYKIDLDIDEENKKKLFLRNSLLNILNKNIHLQSFSFKLLNSINDDDNKYINFIKTNIYNTGFFKEIIEITKGFGNRFEKSVIIKKNEKDNYDLKDILNILGDNLDNIQYIYNNLTSYLKEDSYKCLQKKQDTSKDILDEDNITDKTITSCHYNFILTKTNENAKKDKLQEFKSKLTDFINEDLMRIPSIRGQITHYTIKILEILINKFKNNYKRTQYNKIPIEDNDIIIFLKGNSNFRLLIKKYTKNIIKYIKKNNLKDTYNSTYEYLKYINLYSYENFDNNIFKLSDIDFTIYINNNKFDKDTYEYIKENMSKITMIALYLIRHMTINNKILENGFNRYDNLNVLENLCEKLKKLLEKTAEIEVNKNYKLKNIILGNININKDKCEQSVIESKKKNYIVIPRNLNTKNPNDYYIQDNIKDNSLLRSKNEAWDFFNLFTKVIQNKYSEYFISANKNLDIKKGYIDRSFELFRLRINSLFMFENEKDNNIIKVNVPGELIDISIPKFNNQHQLHFFKTGVQKNMEKVKYTDNEYYSELNLFSLENLIDDLEVIFFQDNFNIWNDKKYSKRVRRYFFAIFTNYIKKQQENNNNELMKNKFIDDINKFLENIENYKINNVFNELGEKNMYNIFNMFLESRTSCLNAFNNKENKESDEIINMYLQDAETFKIDLSIDKLDSEYITDFKNKLNELIEVLIKELIELRIKINEIDPLITLINKEKDILVSEFKVWG